MRCSERATMTGGQHAAKASRSSSFSHNLLAPPNSLKLHLSPPLRLQQQHLTLCSRQLGSAAPPTLPRDSFPVRCSTSHPPKQHNIESSSSQLPTATPFTLLVIRAHRAEGPGPRDPSGAQLLSLQLTANHSEMTSKIYPRGFTPVERNPANLEPKHPIDPPAASVEQLLATIPETPLVKAAREYLEPKLPKNVWNHSQRAYLYGECQQPSPRYRPRS